MGLRDKLNDMALKSVYDKLFNSFDKDNSGSLQPSQVAELLTMALKQTGVNFTVTQQHAQIAMKAVDKNHDGKLNKQEMLQVYKFFIKNIDTITAGGGTKQ